VQPRTGEVETQEFKVRVPAGVQDGQVIRVPGKGGEGLGGAPAGHLYLHVRLAAHPDFRVSGSDLYHDLDLAPWEAVLGTEVPVPSPDGAVTLRIPPGTGGDQRLRVRGRGLPKAGGGRGDLYVVVNLEVPRSVSGAERALWEQLGRVSDFNPRSR
jgi:curved DNA-binding protein